VSPGILITASPVPMVRGTLIAETASERGGELNCPFFVIDMPPQHIPFPSRDHVHLMNFICNTVVVHRRLIHLYSSLSYKQKVAKEYSRTKKSTLFFRLIRSFPTRLYCRARLKFTTYIRAEEKSYGKKKTVFRIIPANGTTQLIMRNSGS